MTGFFDTAQAYGFGMSERLLAQALEDELRDEGKIRHIGVSNYSAEQLADGIGCTVSQLAIAWTLRHPAVHVAIVGSRSPAHIEESVGALDVRLSAADLQQIETVMQGAVTAAGPSPEMNSD